MEAKNPYRTNEFCVNWEDNLLATSMGDAYEVGKQEGIREVLDWEEEHDVIGYVYDTDDPEVEKQNMIDHANQLKVWGL